MTRNITIIGGTGYAGGHIAREAIGRGHTVTSVSRGGGPADPIPGVQYRAGALADHALVQQMAQDSDDLVIAVRGDDLRGELPGIIPLVIAGGARLGIVGGAGSSLVAEGGPRLIDTPEFQDAWKPEASAQADALAILQQAPAELDWFYVSPAAMFGSYVPGEATGSYRTGGDLLVTAEDGTSTISGADYALALVDELENRAHVRRRFTTGY